MKIGIVAPSPVPFCIGGAENVWWGLLDYLNQETSHQADLIKLPSRELSTWDLVDAYRMFAALDLSHFDLLISSKYPGWMVKHPRHVVYMLHRLRGLYDAYPAQLPLEPCARHPQVDEFLRFLRENHGNPARISECLERLEGLRGRNDIEPAVLAFPGPFIRTVLHFLDDAALDPSRIEKYAAIAHNVKNREGYFPAGEQVIVAYPPSNLDHFENGASNYFFTIGRLDAAKRNRLLVEAMLRARTDMHLKIAGTGPDESALKHMAGGDPRLEFLGFVNDSEVVGLYANALAVPYVPYDEDYGLVTIEAMGSGKPVLTTGDAGGPNEFVRHGETGYSVPPDPQALADCIDYLAEHVEQARAMAPACTRQVSKISWEQVALQLIGPSGRKTSRVGMHVRKRKLAVAVTFPIFPPRAGGQSRVYHLYSNLAKQMNWDVDLVTFAEHGQDAKNQEIAPGVREIRVPKSLEHARRERRLSGQMDNVPVTDVVMPKLYPLSPRYEEALAESAANSDILVACHPYLLLALEKVRSNQPLLYEAQDIEILLKRTILPNNRLGRYFLAVTEQMERRSCELSSLILTCSETDARQLKEQFGVSRERTTVAPNGVDLKSVYFTPFEERKRLKHKYQGNSAFAVLFMGSWHWPNIESAFFTLEIARQLPAVRFYIIGSVGAYLEQFQFIPPSNVKILGVVDDRAKNEILSWVDLAINPMESGSGTNLKMFDYMAAGVPVLTTRFGARGIDVEDGVHVFIAPLTRFPQSIAELRRADEAMLSVVSERARKHVAAEYSWQVIAQRLSQRIQQVYRPMATPWTSAAHV